VLTSADLDIGATLWSSVGRVLKPALIGAQEAQNAACMLVEQIEVGRFSAETCRLALKGCTGSLETVQVLAQRDTSLQEPGSRPDAIPMLQRLMDEEAQESRAEKQHQRLPDFERSAIMEKLTTEHVNHAS
jgi:hypothetical protein